MIRRTHKYRAKQTVVDGHKFPSIAEAKRYCELKILQQAGEIRDLALQPRFPLYGATLEGERVDIRLGRMNRLACYVADFAYHDSTGKYRVEDVKGHDLPIAKLKRAIVKACHGVEVEVIKR